MTNIISEVRKIRESGSICPVWDTWSRDLLSDPTDYIHGENYSYHTAARAAVAAEKVMYRLRHGRSAEESLRAERAYYLAEAWACEVGPELDLEIGPEYAEGRRGEWERAAAEALARYSVIPST